MAPNGKSTTLKRDASIEAGTPDSKRQCVEGRSSSASLPHSSPAAEGSSPAGSGSLESTQLSSPPSSIFTTPSQDSGSPPPTDAANIPVIWAKGIGYMADSLPSFRCYQGGTYTSGNEVLGVRVSGFTEPRDILKINVLVTCTGGNRESVVLPGSKNEVYVRKDSTPKELKAWEKAQANKRAVLVIADNKHPEWKTGNIDLSCIPCAPEKHKDIWAIALGAYFIEEIWAEKVQPHEALPPYTVHKIKLCRVETSKPAWWKEDAGQEMPADSTSNLECPTQECTQCNKTSPAIFAGAPWTCLNYKCKAFFTVEGMPIQDTRTLEYSSKFLDSRVPVPEGIIMPQSKAVPVTETGSYGTEDKLWTGMVCLNCGFCCRRREWIGWRCENCSFFHPATINHFPVREVAAETAKHTKKLLKGPIYNQDQVTILKSMEVVLQTTMEENGVTLNIYIVKNDDGHVVGTIVHSRPKEAIVEAENGPDALYQTLENEEEFHKLLRRNPSRCANSPREILTRHFQANFGATYHFSVPVPTTPFEEAPNCMLSALTQLSFYGQQATNASIALLQDNQSIHVAGSTTMEPWKPFNELLALGYMENNKIGWHDDGEGQLTGTVTTLSLGSPATMAWAYNRPGKRVKFLELQLRHADSVTMCGPTLQSFALHEVEPEGLRRYALTARTVNFEFYAPDKRPELQACAKLPERIKNFEFQGLSLTPEEEE